MNVFNSLGSNYNISDVFESLFTSNKAIYQANLIDVLNKKYPGEVQLFYKARFAITAALKLLKLPQDSYVAITGFTCYAVYKAAIDAGCKVQYLDIEQGTLNFSPEILELALRKNPKIRAIIIQNTLGYPCDGIKIRDICKKNSLALIEDLAHCVGSKYQTGEEVGKIGDCTILSFSQDKVIDAVSGGALVIRNQKYKKQSTITSERLNGTQDLKDRLYPLLTTLIRLFYPLGVGKILHRLLKHANLLSSPMSADGHNRLYSLP
ncbi:MAG: DegT/DnrJ/EryC1/StrS family aminotransferase, partial [Candidatus Roizmanbacteria bacterium]